MMDIFFHKFGLTRNEQDIYLFLLEHGASIASMVGKRLQIKRVTIYASLESLIKKNLVTALNKNKVKYFAAVPPEEIVELCKSKVAQNVQLQKAAENILPRLQKLEEKQSKPIFEVQGKIKYYQGLEAVKNLISETLEEDSKEQFCFGLNSYHMKHLRDEWKKYTKNRIANGMSVRSIQPDIAPAKAYKKRDTDELRKTYLIPHTKFPARCELNIIGDMIALFTTHGNEPTGTKIYNKDMAEVLKSLFELAWQKAREYDKK